jgi:hypothetical protein
LTFADLGIAPTPVETELEVARIFRIPSGNN